MPCLSESIVETLSLSYFLLRDTWLSWFYQLGGRMAEEQANTLLNGLLCIWHFSYIWVSKRGDFKCFPIKRLQSILYTPIFFGEKSSIFWVEFKMDQITHLRRTKKWDSFYKVCVDKEWISWCLLSENLVVWNIQMTWDYLFNPWSKEALLSLLGDLWSFKLFSASTRELGLHPTRTIAMVLGRFRYGNNARRKMHLGSPSQWMTITWKQSHLTKL